MPGTPHRPYPTDSPDFFSGFDLPSPGADGANLDSASPNQNGASGFPAMPPMSAPGAGAASNGRGSGYGYRDRREETTANGAAILVRSHSGHGEVAEFDPASGLLRVLVLAVGPVGGLYGELGATPVVFYRGDDGLALWTGGRVIDLEDPDSSVLWRLDGRTCRFVLRILDTVLCDIGYPATSADFDLGLLIRDVLTDPDRRTRIFTR